MQPIISIVIPVYNVEQYIRECLDSIEKQDTKKCMEVLCIDDGSTDKSGNICEEYAKRDKRFKVFHKKNGGVSSARNLGLKNAKGKYIAWIDPDDYISDDWFYNIKLLLNSDIDIIFFDYILLKGKKQVEKKYSNKSKFIDVDLFLEELVIDQRIENQLWQKIFKRTLLENIIFPENVKTMEDYAVLHKIVLKASKIYYLSKSLYFYRIRSNSLVTSTTLEKSYMSYLIAKERYRYLLNRKKNIPKIGYLIKALNVCIQYNKVNKGEKDKNKKIYDECINEINENIIYIFNYKRCNIKIKIKFLLCKIKFFKLLSFINKLIKK